MDSCRPSPMEVHWSIQQTLETKTGGAKQKNTQMQSPQKTLQKIDKTIVLSTKSPETLQKYIWFMSPIAQRWSMIHSANSSNQNRWSNTQKTHKCSLSRRDCKKVTKWIVWSWSQMNFWENIVDSCRPPSMEVRWSIQQTLATKMGGATPKNTQMQPLQKRWQKSNKMKCQMMKSHEFLRKHHGFMSPIAHGSSLIHSANSSVQNRWSNTKKRTIATSSEEMTKKQQNEVSDDEVTWTFEKTLWIHVAHRPWKLPDLFSKL